MALIHFPHLSNSSLWPLLPSLPYKYELFFSQALHSPPPPPPPLLPPLSSASHNSLNSQQYSYHQQINDSSVIISALRSLMLGQDSIEQILGYYPEMTMQGADGKEEKEYVNRYFIMHKVATDKKSMDREKYAMIEEIKFDKILKVTVNNFRVKFSTNAKI